METARLGTAQQQLVEIAKALSQKASILVLDEPTAALTDAESASLFSILKKLRGQGMGIIYISHRLDEVFRLSDRITVLRDGRMVGTEQTLHLDQARVIMRMVGREVSKAYPTDGRTHGETILEVRELCLDDTAGKPVLRGVSFSARRGEVLGIAGLMGAGRTELLLAIFGAWSGKVTGSIFVSGQRTTIRCPEQAVAYGIGLATENRKRSGLVLDQTVLSNMTLAALKKLSGRFITNELQEIAMTNLLLDKMRIKAASPYTIANTLSGGTQQKVVLAKWLLSDPRVLLLDEPTRGIDIAAKQEIYEIVNKLAKTGLAIVMVSSELPEVLGFSDRILVMYEGQLTGEFAREEATPQAVMACATGQMARA
jgi:D-xylose transport system ATP-binding protein